MSTDLHYSLQVVQGCCMVESSRGQCQVPSATSLSPLARDKGILALLENAAGAAAAGALSLEHLSLLEPLSLLKQLLVERLLLLEQLLLLEPLLLLLELLVLLLLDATMMQLPLLLLLELEHLLLESLEFEGPQATAMFFFIFGSSCLCVAGRC